MRNRSFKVLSVLALSVTLGGAAAALAAATVPGPPFPPVPPYPSFCYNVDVTNGTGKPANDLHVTLKGPTQIYSFYSGGHFGPPSNHQYSASSGSWSVDYVSPYDVTPGNIAHVGWCTNTAVNGMTGSATSLPPFYWTKDGKAIGRVSPLGHDWGTAVLNDQRFVAIRFTNADVVPIHIEQLDWLVVDQAFALEDLMPDILADQPWKPAQVEPLVRGGSADAPGSVTAIIPWSVLPTETGHMVFRVVARDPQNPESLIRGFGQANIAAAVAPREGGR